MNESPMKVTVLDIEDNDQTYVVHGVEDTLTFARIMLQNGAASVSIESTVSWKLTAEEFRRLMDVDYNEEEEKRYVDGEASAVFHRSNEECSDPWCECHTTKIVAPEKLEPYQCNDPACECKS